MKNKLRIIRAERKISQDELASLCGVSRATINSVENESVIPNGDTMLRLSNALQIPIQEIFLDFKLFTNNTEGGA